ncbi:SDR family oxidoreductase [Paraburkholderia sp. ZP32-5]|uniref:SDR family oxidoreductase n=1 Tax=Paraburkholderia sp. ZP32-5 TaxID=2883245 RepID=UPI001F293DE2|nr:SDR family oxidoreductase [Paraburkholderia sp. ZP32-5]
MNHPDCTSSSPGRLAGKVAIVSGSTQSLGADIARGLVAAGARVMTLGLGAEAGESIARELGEAGAFIETDITDDAQIDRAIAATLRRFGRLDLLINNACIYADDGLASTREQWARLLDVNLVSAAIFAQKAAPLLPRGGVIVNLGSTGGKFGAAGRALYPASKAALQQFTRNLAVALAPDGIRAVTVSPAWTWSPSLEQLASGSIDIADRVGAAVHPLGRVGRGHEIAQVVAFLCSVEASWITGVDIPVDGGFSILGPDQGVSPREWFNRLG